MKKNLREFACFRCWMCFTAAILIFAVSSGGWAGQKKKKPASGDNSGEATPMPPVAPADEIDHDIGEMLGAFQVGDIEAMHKYYSDNVTFVSSAYEPPLVGWQNYVAVYQRERAAFQGVQLIRRNTFIFPHGDVAWASYQWEFQSSLNGKPYETRGQTTLVFTKVGDNWLIVHNHTSEICPASAGAPQQPPRQAPEGNAPAPAPEAPRQ
ncbi:MAG: YybH family protein [Candidatus Acidiferrales bacterium]